MAMPKKADSSRTKSREMGVVAVVFAMILSIVLLTAAGSTSRGVPAETSHLSPDQVHSLYLSELSFNVTGSTDITLTAQPGANATGSLSLQVFKSTPISIEVLGRQSPRNATTTPSMPVGMQTFLSVAGSAAAGQMLSLTAVPTLHAAPGDTLQIAYAIFIPPNTALGTYHFQFVFVPSGTSYLARFLDVTLVVE
jgi:hypothetical protein